MTLHDINNKKENPFYQDSLIDSFPHTKRVEMQSQLQNTIEHISSDQELCSIFTFQPFDYQNFLEENIDTEWQERVDTSGKGLYAMTFAPSQGMEPALHALLYPKEAFHRNILSPVIRPADSPEKEQDNYHMSSFHMMGMHTFVEKLSEEQRKKAWENFFENLKKILATQGKDFEEFKKDMIFTLNEGGEYILYPEDYPQHIPETERTLIRKKFVFQKDEENEEILKKYFGIQSSQIRYNRPTVKVNFSDPWGEPFCGNQVECTRKNKQGKEIEIGFITFLDHIRIKENKPFYLLSSDQENVKTLHNASVSYQKNPNGCMISGIWGVERVIWSCQDIGIQEYLMPIWENSLKPKSFEAYSLETQNILLSLIDGILPLLQAFVEYPNLSPKRDGTKAERDVFYLLRKIQNYMLMIGDFSMEDQIFSTPNLQVFLDEIVQKSFSFCYKKNKNNTQGHAIQKIKNAISCIEYKENGHNGIPEKIQFQVQKIFAGNDGIVAKMIKFRWKKEQISIQDSSLAGIPYCFRLPIIEAAEKMVWETNHSSSSFYEILFNFFKNYCISSLERNDEKNIKNMWESRNWKISLYPLFQKDGFGISKIEKWNTPELSKKHTKNTTHTTQNTKQTSPSLQHHINWQTGVLQLKGDHSTKQDLYEKMNWTQPPLQRELGVENIIETIIAEDKLAFEKIVEGYIE